MGIIDIFNGCLERFKELALRIFLLSTHSMFPSASVDQSIPVSSTEMLFNIIVDIGLPTEQ